MLVSCLITVGTEIFRGECLEAIFITESWMF